MYVLLVMCCRRLNVVDWIFCAWCVCVWKEGYGFWGDGGRLKGIKVTRCNRMALRVFVCVCMCVLEPEDRSSFLG